MENGRSGKRGGEGGERRGEGRGEERGEERRGDGLIYLLQAEFREGQHSVLQSLVGHIKSHGKHGMRLVLVKKFYRHVVHHDKVAAKKIHEGVSFFAFEIFGEENCFSGGGDGELGI
jgi:hypothetical protein